MGSISLNQRQRSEFASDEVLKYNDKVFRDCIRGMGECAIRVSSQTWICVDHSGTGKMSVSKKELGLLSKDNLVRENPSNFVGACLGEYEKKTRASLESSLDCVQFRILTWWFAFLWSTKHMTWAPFLAYIWRQRSIQGNSCWLNCGRDAGSARERLLRHHVGMRTKWKCSCSANSQPPENISCGLVAWTRVVRKSRKKSKSWSILVLDSFRCNVRSLSLVCNLGIWHLDGIFLAIYWFVGR